jgi:filamin
LDEVKIITHPSEYPCQIEIIDNHDGTWTVNYTPKQIGQIQIDIFLDDKRMNSIPYKINVFDINQVHISNLQNGFVDQLVKFHIDISQAGIGQLEIIVEDGQVGCDVISHSSSQYDVTFLPHTGGLYKIDIRFNGLIIPGNLANRKRIKIFFSSSLLIRQSIFMFNQRSISCDCIQ